MYGPISLIIACFAAAAFLANGRIGMSILSAIVALVSLWSWLHMLYFARVLARQRLFVAALQRGEFAEGSLEGERYWAKMRVSVEPCDAADVPNWIATVNMVASLLGFVLLVWGTITYVTGTQLEGTKLFQRGVIADVAVIAGSGLVLFFIVGNLVDSIIFRVAVGEGDPMENILADAPNPKRGRILNVIRPAVLTLILFGGGLLTIVTLGLGTWGTIAAGVWFFFLTQIACLSGRGASLFQAGWAMLISMGILLAVFTVAK